MMAYIIYGVISLAIILLSCELFTNAVEWTGKKLKLNEGATGSILAAIGTGLPETILPIIAIVTIPGQEGRDIGTGAILGAPFTLGTLAFGVTGIVVLINTLAGKRKPVLSVNEKDLTDDMFFFVVVYVLAMLFSFLPAGIRKPGSFIFLLIYVYYVYGKIRHSKEEKEAALHPLYFHRKGSPPMSAVIAQDLTALAGIILGAKFFTGSIEHLSGIMEINPFVFALFLAPVATESPEAVNSLIWIGKKKDTLAMGNITGTMVFQSCVVVFIGVVGTDWSLNIQAKLSAVIALLSCLVIIIYMKLFKKLNAYVLVSGVFFYLLYIFLIARVMKGQ